MASRTSASVGMMVTLAIFSVLSLGLFVTTIVFFAKVQKLNNELKLKQADLDSALRSDERADRWEELKRLAGNRSGVVRYLDNSLAETTQLVTGSRRDTPDALIEKIKGATADGTPLLRLLQDRSEQIESLTKQLTAAEASRLAAQDDLKASEGRVGKLEEAHRGTIAKLNEEIEGYRSGTERFRSGVEAAKQDMNSRVQKIQTTADSTIASLEGQVSSLESQLLIANDQLRRLRTERSQDTLKPAFEGSLADGHIVGVSAPNRQVYLDLGRRDRLVLGLAFEVYSGGSAIKPGSDGEYPPGKASIEVIRIDEASSVARIVRENAGTPIINGDVVANAVYDPKKVYTFTVYGNFDTNEDGAVTPQELQDVRALIAQWNGRVTDDIGGDTDFLVLGTKPVLPPQPKPTDPVELIQRYLSLKQATQKYDELLEKAQQTGIPVLNQNRLYTLTGLRGQR